MKSIFESVDQDFMEYQKRLKFIEHVKKNFIENDLECKSHKTFLFESYDAFNSIKVYIFEDLSYEMEHYKQFRSKALGVCQFVLDNENIPYLIFEDFYMVYHLNLIKNEYDVNDLKVGFKSDSESVQQQMNSLVRRLNGEQPFKTIFDC